MRYNYLNIVNYNEYFQLNSPSLQALNLENNSAMKNTQDNIVVSDIIGLRSNVGFK